MIDQPIPILFAIQLLDQGGTEDHLYDLVSSLDRRRFAPHVFYSLEGHVARRLMSVPGVEMHRCHVRRAYDRDGFKAVLWLRRFYREQGIRVVVTYHFVAEFVATLAAVGRTAPAVISSRRDMGFNRTPRQFKIGHWLDRRVSRYIAVSEAVRQAIVCQERVRPEKIEVIHNGIDLDRIQRNGWDTAAERRRLGIAPEERVIGCVANFNAVKNHLNLIDAFARLNPGAHPARPRLLLAGDGPMRKPIHQRIAELGLGDRVILVGRSAEVDREFMLSDVVVLPSDSEGFSNTIVQAMAHGKPVVATRVGGNPEAVAEGETGLLVEPRQPAALAGALDRLLSDRELAERLGRAGRLRMEREFTHRTMMERTQDLIERVAGEQRR